MFIIRKILDKIFGSASEHKLAASELIDQILNNEVNDWYDIDDFLHGGFRSNLISSVGRLCAALARKYPGGNYGNLYSNLAVPYLKRVRSVLLKSDREIIQECDKISKELNLSKVEWHIGAQALSEKNVE